MIFRRSSSLRTTLMAMGLMMLISSWAFAQNNAFLAGTEEEQKKGLASILKAPQETQVQALLTLLDLGEVELASKLWSVLGQADFEDPTSAAVAAQIGTARLMRFARRETEADTPFAGARAFVDRCLNAAAAQARDPKRIAKLIADLNDAEAAIRRAARVDLSATGTVGAAACLEALAQAEEEQVRANLMFGLTSLHPEINPLLLAALAEGRGHFRRDAAELAGYLRVKEATPWLAAMVSGDEADPAVISAAVAALAKFKLPVPTARETRALLMQEIEKIEAGVPEWPTDGSGKATWWFWHQESGEFQSSDYDPATFNTLAAERFTRLLTSCGEPTLRERRLALIYHFETRQILGEAASDLMEEKYSTQEISATLSAAFDRNPSRAAISCVQILGSRADSAALVSSNGRPSPLAAAVRHADRELRYAALEAIMKLSPQTTFAGASHVPSALWEFAAGVGAPQAIVASSVAVRGSNWAAQLREGGLHATPTTSGSQAILLAIDSPRLALILIDSDIGRPLLREVVFQLRSHHRTARIPIVVLSSSHNLDRSRRIAEHDDWLLAAPRPHSQEAIDRLVSRLQELGRLQKIGRLEELLQRRNEQAVQALAWISQLLENGHPYDELHRDAAVLQETIYVPGLVEPSLRALAVVGTAGSQQTLLDLTSQNFLPIELRRRAADAFATSVQRVGRQLTTTEVHRQYDRYNASATADEATQQVLGQVLDALERKTADSSPGVATPGL